MPRTVAGNVNMQTRWPWLERTFAFDFPAEKLPGIAERLSGTTARLAAIMAGTTRDELTRRDSDLWSIQENVGHLADLEPLWFGRLQNVVNRSEFRRDAELTNRGTHDANHHQYDFRDIMQRFEQRQRQLIESVEGLNQPPRVVDPCHFVAGHDDDHLARIRYLPNHWRQSGPETE